MISNSDLPTLADVISFLVDRIFFKYTRATLKEKRTMQKPVPHSVVRTAEFHRKYRSGSYVTHLVIYRLAQPRPVAYAVTGSARYTPHDGGKCLCQGKRRRSDAARH